MNASRIITRMPAGDSSSPRFPLASRSFAPAPLHWGEEAKGTEGTPVVAVGRTRTKVSESSPGSSSNATHPDVAKSRLAWIFAAKTTLSALIALLIAFTFNLDQPKWALLTVFVVAQPRSGLVLAKSFYRVIGTLVGAVAALSFVSLFAQERVLFLGALALWIGLCTFASQYAKNFTAYGFVLSGYTAAIVGISGALHPENAFYVAVARATEVGLAIVVTAIISQLLLPASLAPALRQALTAAQIGLAEYAAAILNGRDARSMRSTLLDEARAIRSQYAAAIFEDRDIRERSSAVRRLDAAFMNVINLGELLGWQLAILRGQRGWGETKTGEAIVEAAAAL